MARAMDHVAALNCAVAHFHLHRHKAIKIHDWICVWKYVCMCTVYLGEMHLLYIYIYQP